MHRVFISLKIQTLFVHIESIYSQIRKLSKTLLGSVVSIQRLDHFKLLSRANTQISIQPALTDEKTTFPDVFQGSFSIDNTCISSVIQSHRFL